MRLKILTTGAVVLTTIIMSFGVSLAGNGRVRILNNGDPQTVITTMEGRRIFIDVADPSSINELPGKGDILIETHSHPDHWNQDFIDSFPGKSLITSEGEIVYDDVVVRGIASAHIEGNEITPDGATNYIFVIETKGIRIAHLGDIGQDRLTKRQLDAIGKIDILITQFNNPYSGMDISNMKGFNIVSQVNPEIILPTHNSEKELKYAASIWKCLYSADSELEFTSVTDSGKRAHRFILMGTNGKLNGKQYHAKKISGVVE